MIEFGEFHHVILPSWHLVFLYRQFSPAEERPPSIGLVRHTHTSEHSFTWLLWLSLKNMSPAGKCCFIRCNHASYWNLKTFVGTDSFDWRRHGTAENWCFFDMTRQKVNVKYNKGLKSQPSGFSWWKNARIILCTWCSDAGPSALFYTVGRQSRGRNIAEIAAHTSRGRYSWFVTHGEGGG